MRNYIVTVRPGQIAMWAIFWLAWGALMLAISWYGFNKRNPVFLLFIGAAAGSFFLSYKSGRNAARAAAAVWNTYYG